MKQIFRYRNLLYVLIAVAWFGNFAQAKGMEEKPIVKAGYGLDKKTGASRFGPDGDLDEKDLRNDRKQARKKQRKKRREERRAKQQESNGDYWDYLLLVYILSLNVSHLSEFL